MKADDIFDGVTDVRDDLIDGAGEAPKQRSRWTKRRWLGVVAAVLAVAILGGVLLRPGSGLTAYAIAQAEYPSSTGRVALDENPGRDRFLAASTARFLTGTGTDNRIYSPLNAYLALSMLAEITGGDSRGQILDLLGEESVEALRDQAGDLWRANYRSGVTTSLLANSLWLRDGMTYSEKTLGILAKDYYASSFSGKMGSGGYNRALRDWINQQTHNLLKEQAGGLELNPDTVMALVSTLYFKGEWQDPFEGAFTQPYAFHAPGREVEADFMHQSFRDSFYWGDNFTAMALRYKLEGKLWLILPDEGVTVDELLDSGEAMDFLFAPKADRYDSRGSLVKEGWTGQKETEIHLSLPRFDVSSDLSLMEGLKELGVTDVFDWTVSNFEPLGASTDKPLYVYKVQHAARVTVGEKGTEAAAYTEIDIGPGAEPPLGDEVYFTLDRPFLFAVTLDSGLPLFVGVVNNPMKAA